MYLLMWVWYDGNVQIYVCHLKLCNCIASAIIWPFNSDSNFMYVLYVHVNVHVPYVKV